MTPPAIALMGAKAGLKASRQYSVAVLGYDFLGLIMRIGVFLLIGVLVQGYFTAAIKGGNWLAGIAGFFGMKFPSTLPEWLVKLFTTGWNGVAFWQILQITAILLVLVEYFQYDRMLKEKGEKPNVTTQGVFLLIGLALALMVVPETIQKIQERRIVNG